jgi:hypothetical protein
MSQPPFPPQPTPYAAPPRKPRPRFIWFVVGGALLVLAPIVFLGALLLALGPLTQSDGVFAADGSPHELTVSADERRALFVPVDERPDDDDADPRTNR